MLTFFFHDCTYRTCVHVSSQAFIGCKLKIKVILKFKKRKKNLPFKKASEKQVWIYNITRIHNFSESYKHNKFIMHLIAFNGKVHCCKCDRIITLCYVLYYFGYLPLLKLKCNACVQDILYQHLSSLKIKFAYTVFWPKCFQMNQKFIIYLSFWINLRYANKTILRNDQIFIQINYLYLFSRHWFNLAHYKTLKIALIANFISKYFLKNTV